MKNTSYESLIFKSSEAGDIAEVANNNEVPLHLEAMSGKAVHYGLDLQSENINSSLSKTILNLQKTSSLTNMSQKDA